MSVTNLGIFLSKNIKATTMMTVRNAEKGTDAKPVKILMIIGFFFDPYIFNVLELPY